MKNPRHDQTHDNQGTVMNNNNRFVGKRIQVIQYRTAPSQSCLLKKKRKEIYCSTNQSLSNSTARIRFDRFDIFERQANLSQYHSSTAMRASGHFIVYHSRENTFLS